MTAGEGMCAFFKRESTIRSTAEVCCNVDIVTVLYNVVHIAKQCSVYYIMFAVFDVDERATCYIALQTV